MRCALGKHEIVGESKFFTDKYLLSFVKKCRREFRAAYAVCEKCYNDIVYVYNKKKASHIKKLKEKRLVNNRCVSDPSVSTTASSRNDYLDRLVYRTPRNPSLKVVVSESRTETSANAISSDRITTTSSSGSSLRVATQSQDLSSSTTTGGRGLPSLRNQPSPLNTQPSTSAAAARRQKSGGGGVLSDSSSNVAQNDYDPWNDIPSPAALDGTRLPHVQPILKRKGKQVVSLNKDRMHLYLKDITGG